MIIVKYATNGMKSVVAEDLDAKAARSFLSQKAKTLKKQGWFVDWYGSFKFEATHDDVAFGVVYRTRPNDWPVTQGEPL